MPLEYQMSTWTQSLLATCESSKTVVGFDGPFTLPTEQRLLVEAAEAGGKHMLLRLLKALNLPAPEAKKLYYSMVSTHVDLTLAEVESELKTLLRATRHE